MLYLTNSFSVHMFGRMEPGECVRPRFEAISKDEAAYMLQGENFRSYFGHSDTSVVLSKLLHVTINENRGLLTLKPGDRLIIASLQSKRRFEQGYDADKWFYFWYVTFLWR